MGASASDDNVDERIRDGRRCVAATASAVSLVATFKENNGVVVVVSMV